MRSSAQSDRFRSVVTELVFAAARLAGVGLVAVGVSGLLAWGMGAVAGKAFVSGDAPGVVYTAARCRDFFEYAPHAKTCAQAAATHHFGEIVWYRVAAGLFGGLVIAVTARVARRRGRGALLPATFVPTVAAATFGIAAAWLLGQGADLVRLDVNGGGGAYLSGGVVALAVALWFAVPVVKSLDVQRTPTVTA